MSENQSYQPGDMVNGYVLTSHGQWLPIAAPPGSPAGPSTEFGPVPAQPAPKRRTGKEVVLGVAGAAVLIIVIAVATSGGGDEPGTVAAGDPSSTASAESSTDEAGGTDEAGNADAVEPVIEETVEEVDLSAFAEIDAAAWDQIVKDPDTAVGQKVIVFAEVTQFDSATGSDIFRANVGSAQPAAEFELQTNTIVGGTEESLEPVVQGDVVRLHAEVSGSFEYETQIGGSTVVPSLTAVAVESVGYLDITGDAMLGAPVWGEYGGVDVPVTITNTSNMTMNFVVEVVAETPDGSVQLGATRAHVQNLAPGQAAQAEASFFEDLPADSVFKVIDVSRNNY